MKAIISSVLVLVSISVQAQRSMTDEIAANKKRAQELTVKAVGTNLVRLSEGKVYNVLHSTNWVTIPGIYERGKFLRNTPEGPAFEIESLYYVGTYSTEFRYERTIIVTNCPTQFRVTGEAMPAMRVRPVGTSTFFVSPAPVYDWGTPPPGTNFAARAAAGTGRE